MIQKKKRGCFSQVIQAILFSINIIFMLLLFLAKGAWTSPPSEGLFFPFLGLTYIVWFSVNILALLFWLVVRRWIFIIVQLAVIIFCWPTISVYCPIHVSTPEKDIPTQSIKVMTYNIDALQNKLGKEARENPIFDYIKSSNADIICLQEMYLSQNNNPNGIITYNDLKKIFSEYPYTFFQVNNIIGVNQHGIMVLSKYPIKTTEKIELWSTFNGALLCELEIDGKSLCLINTHLESNRITESDKQLYKDFIKQRRRSREVEDNIKTRMRRGYELREEQVDVIQSYLNRQNSDYVVVCGDFNDTPISYTYYHMTNGLNLLDSFVESGSGLGISFREKLFPFRIDYILHSKNIQSYNTKVHHVEYSDHYPFTTTLVLQ